MDWVRARKLGHGSFATVSLAIPRSDKTPLMAVKTCIASRAATLMNEKSILEELKDCPEIIKCFGDCFTYEHSEEAYNLLLEYAPNGTLHDKLKSFGNRTMSEREVWHYTKALLRGLRRIHGLGYVHCDLKPQNILLFPEGALKIADFGLARKLGSVPTTTLRGLRGTPMYMSPEMLALGDQGSPADVWAAGCIVVEMLTGAPMLRCSNLAELVTIDWSARVEDALGKNSLSDVARDFIRRCLEGEPSDRWTAEMLLSHPFVCNDDDDDEEEEEERSMENCVSTSPRCVFDFPEGDYLCSFTSLPSSSRPSCSESVQRLKMLDCDRSLDWSVSDNWVTVRLGEDYNLCEYY